MSEKLDCVDIADVGNLIRHLHTAREQSSQRRQRQQAKVTKQSIGIGSSSSRNVGVRGNSALGVSEGAAELAIEQCQGLASQITKKILF